VLRTRKAETNPSLVGEMGDTPPGSQATACCSRDYTGTWENLCLPSDIGNLLYKDVRVYGIPVTKTQPVSVWSGTGNRDKNKPLLMQ
jgi:hypothetical protein